MEIGREIEILNAVDSAAQYNQELKRIEYELAQEGFQAEAEFIKNNFYVIDNRFARQMTVAMMKEKVQGVTAFLNNLKDKTYKMDAECMVEYILNQFPLFCKRLYRDQVHGKCSSNMREYLPKLCIENEYDLQRMVYAAISVLFPDVRIEEVEDSGHHMIRKDIVLDKEDIAIELKCTRNSMTERDLSEEIAADMIHYGNKIVFFYIYDKENCIQSPGSFQAAYEQHCVDDKSIHVVIFQPKSI